MTNGVVDQSNFHDYRVARMNEAPQRTNVYIVDSDAPPAGVGEPGVPPFVPLFAMRSTRQRASASGNCP